jgi:hypothetical protein
MRLAGPGSPPHCYFNLSLGDAHRWGTLPHGQWELKWVNVHRDIHSNSWTKKAPCAHQERQAKSFPPDLGEKKLTAWDCVWEGNKYIWILFWRGGGTVWTRGLALARQSQYHLGHAPTHFYVLFFFFPEIGSQILLFVLPHRAGMTGVCHHAQPLVEMASPAQARLGEELVRHHLNK